MCAEQGKKVRKFVRVVPCLASAAMLGTFDLSPIVSEYLAPSITTMTTWSDARERQCSRNKYTNETAGGRTGGIVIFLIFS